MLDVAKKIIKKVRIPIVRFIKPKRRYFFFDVPRRNLEPISKKYGFDRGLPIDRYYIEKFLQENRIFVKGRCLEVTDHSYTKRFGGKNVKRSDVIDIDNNNRKANIKADLRNAKVVRANTYDCIILTHVLGVVDDYEAVIRECKRMLKKGGALLVTASCMNRVDDLKRNYWRFTRGSFDYIFRKYFPGENIQIKTYGNVLAGQAFWVGVASEELTQEELDLNDSHYPIIVAAKVIK